MKKILLLALAAMLAGSAVEKAAAQPRVQLGVRAGVTSQDMKLKIADFGGDNFVTQAETGFHLAAISCVRLSAVGSGALGLGLFLQPEIVYSQNTYKIQRNGTIGASKIRMQSVEIPVLLSVKVSLVRVQAGPVFNVMYRNETTKGDIGINPLRPSVGYALGASIDIIGGLVLDGRFNGQFKELKNGIMADEKPYHSVRGSLSSWAIGLSYLW